MSSVLTSLNDLNTFDQERFVAVIGRVFEHSPWIAAEAWRARPFASLQALHTALGAVVDNATREQQLALIRAHPDLVGRAALAGTLGAESTSEQAAAGLNRLSADEINTFTHLNRAYHDRFDFPFVICARENKKDSILAGFQKRLDNTHEEEIATALGEIKKIAWLRLVDAVDDSPRTEN